MNKKTIISFSIITALFISISFFVWKANRLPRIKEITKPEQKSISEIRERFSLERILSGNSGSFNTCVFRGRISDLKEYSATWVDQNGDRWDDDRYSIVEVETEENYGNQPLEKTVRVLYLSSVTDITENSIVLKKGVSYFFINCWMLDDKYFSYCAEHDQYGTWKDDPSLKEADAILGAAWCSVIPIENDQVYMYHEYVASDEEIGKALQNKHSEKALTLKGSGLVSNDVSIINPVLVRTDLLTDKNAFLSGDFAALNAGYFEELLKRAVAD